MEPVHSRPILRSLDEIFFYTLAEHVFERVHLALVRR
jgi:hypothetical protein